MIWEESTKHKVVIARNKCLLHIVCRRTQSCKGCSCWHLLICSKGGRGRGSWMDIFIRKMTSYLPCPPSISPPPALFPPQPHSQHVRSFDSYDSASPLLTAHPFICAAVAVFTVFAAMEKNAPEVAHPVYSFPITLLSCPHVRSSHGKLRHAGLWSHFSPPRPVIVLTGGWHSHNGPELLAKLSDRRGVQNTDTHTPHTPPTLGPHSSLPCFDRWRQMWFSSLQRSLLNLIYRWISSCPDHL